MSILVFAEQRKKRLRKAAKEAVSQGRALGDELGVKASVLLAGSGLSDLVAEIKAYGPHEIYLADEPGLDVYQTEVYAGVLETMIHQLKPGLVGMAHSAMAKDLAPRIAQRTQGGLVSDCVETVVDHGEISFVRPIYAGKALARMKIATPLKIVTLRPNAFPAVERKEDTEVKGLQVYLTPPRARVNKLDISEGEGPELTEADIIVSGGRGLGGEEGFSLVQTLATRLGAALGASRSAVDAGWRDHQYQVGQTGKVVRSKLYVALGISGAIQHIAGMGTSKCIVAVNKDPDANIFRVAYYGIVGDLYDVVPIMIDQLKA